MKKTKLIVLLNLLLLLTACRLPFNLFSSSESPQPSEQKSFNIGEIFEILPVEISTPTLLPSSSLDDADFAFFSGDLDNAQQLYQSAYDQTGDIEIKSSSMLGLGKIFYARRDYSSAIDTFNRLLGQYPNSEAAVNAYFLIGESYFEKEEFLQAAKAYAKYAELKPGVIDNLVRTYQGNAAMSGGDFQQAIVAYQAALQSNPPGNCRLFKYSDRKSL